MSIISHALHSRLKAQCRQDSFGTQFHDMYHTILRCCGYSATLQGSDGVNGHVMLTPRANDGFCGSRSHNLRELECMNHSICSSSYQKPMTPLHNSDCSIMGLKCVYQLPSQSFPDVERPRLAPSHNVLPTWRY